MDVVEIWADEVVAALHRAIAANTVDACRPPAIESWVREVDQAVDDADCDTFAQVSLLVLKVYTHHGVHCLGSIGAAVGLATKVASMGPRSGLSKLSE